MPLKIKKRGSTLHIEGTLLGKRIRKTTNLPTHMKAQAEIERVQLEKTILEGRYTNSSGVSVGQACKDYANNPTSRCSVTEMRVIAELLVEFDKQSVKVLTIPRLQQFVLDSWSALSPNSTRRYVAVINAILNNCNRMHNMELSRLPNPNIDDARDEHLSEKEAFQLLRVTNKQQYANILMLLITTGVRLGEGLRCEYKDFDGSNLEVKIPNGRSRGKTRTRLIPITYKPLYDVLSSKVGKEEKVCHDVSSLVLNKYLRNILSSIGVHRHVRVHDLRHTFAWLSARAGCDVGDIQLMLGHKDISQTMRYRGWIEPRVKENLTKIMS